MLDDFHADLPVLSEEELAAWLVLRGERVVCHHGRFWRARPSGFFHAVHPLAQLTDAEATRPHPWCWGYRATLRAADAHLANATLPLHFLDRVQDFDLGSFKPRRRNQIRNCCRRVEIVAIREPGLLLSQGYDVVVSSQLRTGQRRVADYRQYRRGVEGFFADRCGLVLGGLIDGRLGGYYSGYAVGETAYIEEVILATEALGTYISSGLFFAWLLACRNSGRIRELVHGLHTPENPSLCRYKESLGLSVRQVPSRVWFVPPSEEIVRSFQPHVYYRLRGAPAELAGVVVNPGRVISSLLPP